ncbi:lichenicidin A2 family type 2 lantibiotic [Lacrimispora sp.]|jgi:type 2 lantibiotic (TIGR03893 family)|uniref:lichenicidin A2 family type 2 lantibiotic n=1 Tax=Lacrimispora sp. TaxID=2719234 RepID=UPI0028AE106D|nr:lichenicidin A2 family type 2 lantibiotic [Lacrimispora sp.]
MDKKVLNNLVGLSFEDLSIEEMQELQGASGVEVNSTPSIIYSALSTAASAAASAQVSKAVSTLITAAAKCE